MKLFLSKRNYLWFLSFFLIVGFTLLWLPPIKAIGTEKSERIYATDPDLRLNGFQKYLKMTEKSPFKDLKWQHIGPTNVSGRCTDIAVIPPKGENYTIFVATASGGVWKTDNEGTTWEPVFDKAPSTSIGDVTVAPSNPEIVWIGTGEANIFRSSQAGIGVYKSTDGGKTWEHKGLADTYTIPRIVIHPENPDIVYVAASGHEWTDNSERGVYKSVDGGETWEKILYISPRTGAIDLVMDPEEPETLYAAVWQRIRLKWNDPRNLEGYSESGLYKTTDGGETWEPINNGLPEGKYRGRIGIDVCLSHPDILYALVDNYEISREPTEEELKDPYGIPSCGFIKGATVYRSDDKGENWTKVAPQTEEMKTYLERHSGTYGWVFGQIRVDPNDPDTVYIMGVPLSVSNDGGKTFRELKGMHADHHGLWIDPANSDYLINANDGGIVISYDRGKTWRHFTHNLPVCQFFNVSYDMDTPFHVYGSMQDHGSFRGVVDLSRGRDVIPAVPFERAPGGEGSWHAIDPGNPDIVYSAGFYGHITRTDLSQPPGKRQKNIYPARFPDEPRYRGQWMAPIVLSPSHPQTVYLGLQYVFRSRFMGDIWERISPDLTCNDPAEMGDIPYQTIFTISESPLNHDLIYVGTDDGRVHVTRDGGKSWHQIMRGLPYKKWVSRITASAFDMGTVYMTLNGKRDDDFNVYVWKSTDFGKTWQDISGNIPVGPVNVIVEDPVDPEILYVGTDGGVFVSTDRGKSWNVLGGNLPFTYVLDLIVHPRENIIVIATHGRGMWALDANPVNGGHKPRRWYD